MATFDRTKANLETLKARQQEWDDYQALRVLILATIESPGHRAEGPLVTCLQIVMRHQATLEADMASVRKLLEEDEQANQPVAVSDE